MQRAVSFTHLADTVIHPRPAALVLAGVQVEVEAAAQFVVLVEQIEETHIRVVDIHISTLFRGDAINALNHFEQAVNRFVLREIRAELLVANAVQVLFLFFAIVSDIPRLKLIHAKFSFGKGAQLCQLFFTLRAGTFCQIG